MFIKLEKDVAQESRSISEICFVSVQLPEQCWDLYV